MFRYTRNPNYLGETMIYTSYAFLAAHWLGWLIVAYALLIVWLPRMYRKEVALSRHSGWAEYRTRTGMLLPRIAQSQGGGVA
jgi:protein-S-isoprenylcysteine O-methyltransferase Ste14